MEHFKELDYTEKQQIEMIIENLDNNELFLLFDFCFNYDNFQESCLQASEEKKMLIKHFENKICPSTYDQLIITLKNEFINIDCHDLETRISRHINEDIYL